MVWEAERHAKDHSSFGNRAHFKSYFVCAYAVRHPSKTKSPFEEMTWMLLPFPDESHTFF